MAAQAQYSQLSQSDHFSQDVSLTNRYFRYSIKRTIHPMKYNTLLLREGFKVRRMCMNQNTFFVLARFDASPFTLIHCFRERADNSGGTFASKNFMVDISLGDCIILHANQPTME